ncbi:MAG: hypothetical protein Q8R70_11110 [Methanoregula sp.]|nr:hypothetical protein [Methanoregula sp.]
MEIRKTAVLFVVISLIATAFMPLAIAQPMETNYARWTVPDTNIKLLSDDGRTAVYTMLYRFSETDTRYYHIEKRREVTADGKETGTILVQTQDPCGSDIRGSFGKESNYTKTQKRLWIHLTPEDMEAVYSGEDGHLKFAGLFAVATGLPPGESVLFVDDIWPTTWPGHWLWTNADDSLDFYMSAESIARIPVAIKNSYCLWISVGFGGNIKTSYCL